jgi:hypothetical protein
MTRTPYRSGRLVTALLLTAGLTVPAASTAGAEPPGPVNAGNTFKWGVAKVDYDFKQRLSHRAWHTSGGHVGTQHGMLTLEAGRHGTVTATENVPGRKLGRWEIRLRSASYGGRGADYRVTTELVPGRGRDQHCGGRNVALESYVPQGGKVQHYVRSGPDLDYGTTKRHVGLRDNQWHTFAVEVTRQRISWFVDAKVVSSERRGAALSGTPFALRFRLEGRAGQRMTPTRMQMDWARYWTLERPNQRSTKAPALDRGTYGSAC